MTPLIPANIPFVFRPRRKLRDRYREIRCFNRMHVPIGSDKGLPDREAAAAGREILQGRLKLIDGLIAIDLRR